MAGRRRVSNPLALAVLAHLLEKPMHPYEMSRTMRARHKEASIKLNYGSLYSVVDKLQNRGLIEPQETLREGRRPERTVYAITEAGRTEYEDWMAELLSQPAKEYTQYEAALSLMGGLPPDEVIELLEQRCNVLDMQLKQSEFGVADLEQTAPRIFLVEWDYVNAMWRAELDWTRALVEAIKDGSYGGVELWRDMYASDGPSAETRERLEQLDVTEARRERRMGPD
ncbi:MAG: PadR family transcriptional regulator [Streptosporangiales bacterium]